MVQTKIAVYTPTFIFLPNCLHSALNAQIALIFNTLRSVDTIKNRIHHCVHAPLHNASLPQNESGFTA